MEETAGGGTTFARNVAVDTRRVVEERRKEFDNSRVQFQGNGTDNDRVLKAR